jgi:hypothetical protein
MPMTETESPSAKTISEFCRAKRISKWSYYEMKKRGIGPDEFIIPGTAVIRITPQSEAAWDQRIAELSKSKAAKLEAQRRSAQTAQAGKIAAMSPKHPSRRQHRPKR